ncbi:hypothetical protein ACFPZN_20535 [Actinomadura rugatobispora]|uniref:Uncharacterized protein n=2 Tax=Actinomadura rugatobispora TaxID=1994 RepID=A0ABW0ZXH9_9ACTN
MLAVPVAALPVILAPPAQASIRYCTDPHTWGRVCFQPDGEILYVEDNEADGHHVRGFAWSESVEGTPATYECKNTKGAGTVRECNFSWPERHRIYFFAALYEGDKRLASSDSKSAYA